MNKYELLAWLFPNKCLLCGTHVNALNPICEKCNRQKLNKRNFTIKTSKINKFFEVYSLGEYDKFLRKCILRYKFKHKTSYARKFSWAICEKLDKDEISAYDIITYVPLTKKRQKERGYNQAELLARKISLQMNLEMVSTLEKIKDNHVQSSLVKADRLKNVLGIYKTSADVLGKNIIIVDDILTTGATINECAKMLYKSGAKNVMGICIASKEDGKNMK